MSRYKDGERYVIKETIEWESKRIEIKGTSRVSYKIAGENLQKNKKAKIKELLGINEVKTRTIKLCIALPDYYSRYCEKIRTANGTKSSTTIRGEKSDMKAIIKELGRYSLKDITTDVIQDFLNSMAEKGLASQTIKHRRSLLDQFFRHIDPNNNPVTGTRMPATKEKRNAPSAMSDDEIERFSSSDELDILKVILWAFLRVGEAIELRVKDIDLDNQKIRIERQYIERDHKVKEPKDRSKRTVPIHPNIRLILANNCKGKSPDDLVFTQKKENNHENRYLRSMLLDNLKKACQNLELEPRVIHDLRHDGISYYIRHGNSFINVAKWAGHRDSSFTLRVYQRQTAEDTREDLGQFYAS